MVNIIDNIMEEIELITNNLLIIDIILNHVKKMYDNGYKLSYEELEPEQKKAIERHGNNLLAIFPEAEPRDPVKLCKRLRRLEGEAGRAALDHCNGDTTTEQWEQASEKAAAKLDRILHYSAAGVPCFINGDPRGYALKIRSEWVAEHRDQAIYRDWGGYGILAPEIGPEGM